MFTEEEKKEYIKYTKIWDLIHLLNSKGVHAYGVASYTESSDITLYFENDEQLKNYKAIFD